MTGFFRRRNDELEDRLRGLGSEPRSDLVSELSGEIRASRIPARMRTRRFAAALVATAMMLIPFAAFGGVGLAASAAKTAVHSVVNTGHHANSKLGPRGVSPDQDQYRPGWGCGDKNHIHTGPPGNPGATSPCKKARARKGEKHQRGGRIRSGLLAGLVF
jgi:hypothetical protein